MTNPFITHVQKGKRTYINGMTPMATLAFPRLNKPDRFKDGDPLKYSAKFQFTQGDPMTAAFIAELEAEYQAGLHVALQRWKEDAKTPKAAEKRTMDNMKQADKPWKVELDDDDEPTGNIVVNLKVNAFRKDRTTGQEIPQRPTLIDSQTHPIAVDTIIGGGSKAIGSFSINPFYTDQVGGGISLRLRGVQVLEMVEYVPGQATPEQLGFSARDDGFVAEASGGDDSEDVEAPAVVTGVKRDF